jgi:hypothetical protein
MIVDEQFDTDCKILAQRIGCTLELAKKLAHQYQQLRQLTCSREIANMVMNQEVEYYVKTGHITNLKRR